MVYKPSGPWVCTSVEGLLLPHRSHIIYLARLASSGLAERKVPLGLYTRPSGVLWAETGADTFSSPEEPCRYKLVDSYDPNQHATCMMCAV